MVLTLTVGPQCPWPRRVNEHQGVWVPSSYGHLGFEEELLASALRFSINRASNRRVGLCSEDKVIVRPCTE